MIRSLVLLIALSLSTAAQAANTDFTDFPHWRYVLEHEQFTPPSHAFAGDLKPVLDRMHTKYHRIPYKTDVQNFGEWNHWATRQETRAHGAADCKGIAEAELFDLLELGVADEDVVIVVATDRRTNELHAVTRAREWVLDIRAPRLLSVEEFERLYSPIFSINRVGWERHNQQMAAE